MRILVENIVFFILLNSCLAQLPQFNVTHTDMLEQMGEFAIGETLLLLSNGNDAEITADKMVDILSTKYGEGWFSLVGSKISIKGLRIAKNTTLQFQYKDKSVTISQQHVQQCNDYTRFYPTSTLNTKNISATSPSTSLVTSPRESSPTAPSTTQSIKPSGCPNGWNPLNNKCIKFKNDPHPYFVVQQVCKSAVKNGNILSIHSEEEQNHLMKMIKGMPSPYIGINKDGIEDWTWTDNTPVNYKNFGNQTSIPNNFKCVIFNTNSTQTGKWIKVNCYDSHPVICESERR